MAGGRNASNLSRAKVRVWPLCGRRSHDAGNAGATEIMFTIVSIKRLVLSSAYESLLRSLDRERTELQH